jgi:hypothetical protein
MINSNGLLEVNVRHKRFTVKLSNDIIRYYEWFIVKKFWVRINTPKFGGHITISNDKLHNNINWKDAFNKFNGKKVDFKYNPNIIIGGRTKGFYLFYMMVESQTIENIKNYLGVVEHKNYKGLHITIGSIGKNGHIPQPYWPIPIKIAENNL